MASFLIILLYLSFPLLCILSIPPPSNRSGGSAERLVSGIALYQGLLLATGLALGLTNRLTASTYGTVMLCLTVPLAALSWRNGLHPDSALAIRWWRTRRGKAVALPALLLAIIFALEVAFDAVYGTRHNDGLMYHIPRVVFWLQQHGFTPWPTPNWEQLSLPMGANLILGSKILLGSGWRGIGYVTCILSVGAVACVYLVALDLGLQRWHAVLTAILFGSFPAVGLRIWSVNSDMAAAFPVLASFVALHRARDPRHGLAFFFVLNGVALACKPTVAPYALLLAGISLWRCRHKLAGIRDIAVPCAALVLASLLMLGSYWPVYATFSDFLGGAHGRGKKIATVAEFGYAVAMSFGHWLLEPLGYLAPVAEDGVREVARRVYNLLGERFIALPESWKPWPGQDIGHSGLAALLTLPVLLFSLPLRARMPASLLFLLGFLSVSGMLCFTPYNSRYTVVLLAGYGVIWGASKIFRRGRGRWVLAGVCTLNVLALLGVVLVRGYVDITVKMRPGGAHYYLSDADRGTIAATLQGNPLLVMADDTPDALLWGTEIDYLIGYICCPGDEDWVRELRSAARRSGWLAVAHGGREAMAPGPHFWDRPGVHRCPEVPLSRLDDALMRAGWQRYRQGRLTDLWRHF